jgi:hypothetical protein
MLKRRANRRAPPQPVYAATLVCSRRAPLPLPPSTRLPPLGDGHRVLLSVSVQRSSTTSSWAGRHTLCARLQDCRPARTVARSPLRGREGSCPWFAAAKSRTASARLLVSRPPLLSLKQTCRRPEPRGWSSTGQHSHARVLRPSATWQRSWPTAGSGSWRCTTSRRSLVRSRAPQTGSSMILSRTAIRLRLIWLIWLTQRGRWRRMHQTSSLRAHRRHQWHHRACTRTRPSAHPHAHASSSSSGR